MIWRVWRQDHNRNNQRMFWFVESQYETYGSFIHYLKSNGLAEITTLNTESGEPGFCVILSRRHMAINWTSVYSIDTPDNLRFIE